MGTEASQRHDPDVVVALVADLAMAAGVPPADARRFGDALVDADVQGVATHGVSRLAIYLRRMEAGLIDPRAELHVERRRPGVLVADAGSGLGQVQALRVLDRLFPIAAELGVASATIKNSQHFGSVGYYCNLAAAREMILIGTTNAEPAMPPFGGREAYFGTNPVAASFPTGMGFPVRVDMSTSVVARGHIIAAAKRGEAIPSGWAIDERGEPTTDSEAALAGAVLTMAGHKGYALALMVEAFSSVLSGASIGPAVGSMYKNLDRKQDVGHFFCLLDISAFMDVADFKERIDAMIADIKASERRPGVDEIFVPGELEHRKIIENRRDGVRIDEATLAELAALCERYGVTFPLDS